MGPEPRVVRAMRPLTDRSLASGARALARSDPHLAAVLSRHGAPPLWGRQPGFATLVQIILEQQVSLSAGRAAYQRLERLAGEVTPERVAMLSEPQLRTAGLTRQKSAYIRGLALAITAGDFDPDAVTEMDDDTARAELIKLKGVGAWTADIYLLMALGRADIWPSGDLALVAAIREVKRMRSLPNADRIGRVTNAWRPWRAVAARVLWHHYLSTPRLRTRVSAAKRSPDRAPAPPGRRARRDPRSRTDSR
jgi:DNA-3-methyladenine glycosylase II